MEYFIFYHFVTIEGKKGFGNTSVFLEQPINSMTVIEAIQEEIKNQKNFADITISDWKQF